MAAITENDDDDDKNGDDTRDDTRTRIHEESRGSEDRGMILRVSETER